jgi:hypothetical protein
VWGLCALVRQGWALENEKGAEINTEGNDGEGTVEVEWGVNVEDREENNIEEGEEDNEEGGEDEYLEEVEEEGTLEELRAYLEKMCGPWTRR